MRVLLILLLAIGHAAAAANLVRNAGFDTDISAWDITGSCFAPAWDSFGNPPDGALAINCFPDSSVETVTQCVPVPATDLDFSAQAADNGMPGVVSFGLVAYPDAGCTGVATTLLDPATASVVPDGGCCGVVWILFSRSDIPVPSDTHGVLVEIVVNAPADIALDDIQLGPSLFRDGFEAGL